MNTFPNDLSQLDHQMLLEEAAKMRELLQLVYNGTNEVMRYEARLKVYSYIESLSDK